MIDETGSEREREIGCLKSSLRFATYGETELGLGSCPRNVNSMVKKKVSILTVRLESSTHSPSFFFLRTSPSSAYLTISFFFGGVNFTISHVLAIRAFDTKILSVKMN